MITIEGKRSILKSWIIIKLITILIITNKELYLSRFKSKEDFKNLKIEKCADCLPEANSSGWKIDVPHNM